MENTPQYVIEMNHITKEFPGIKANDDITLQLKRGEIHALLGENGAGKSTLMSVLFGLYQPEEGEIRKNGEVVKINNPNDATALGIGMVHQHFKLVECFSVLDNIILGVEDTKNGILQREKARKKVMELSQKYGLLVNPDAIIEDISVGMQQRTEILKMLYRDNEILIFEHADEKMAEGMSARDAAYDAGRRRMVPIFLTTATTAVGVIPMIIAGSSFWMPVGITIFAGGIGTLILIVNVLPVVYWKLNQGRDKNPQLTNTAQK